MKVKETSVAADKAFHSAGLSGFIVFFKFSEQRALPTSHRSHGSRGITDLTWLGFNADAEAHGWRNQGPLLVAASLGGSSYTHIKQRYGTTYLTTTQPPIPRIVRSGLGMGCCILNVGI